MAAALILGVHPLVHDHLGHLHADDAGTEGDDVGVVVLLAQAGRIGLAAHAGTHALDLVGGQADAHAGAADQHTAVHFAGGDHLAHLVAADGVVEALGAVGTDVDDLDALVLQILLDFFLHFHCDVVVANCQFHTDTLLIF